VTRRFVGKVVVVTGAGSGIGRAMAMAFSAEGAIVVAADQDSPSAAETAAALEQASAALVDVTQAASVARLIADTHTRHGRLDILCNNAGIGSSKTVVDCEPDEWDQLFAVNVRGVYLGCKYAIPIMIAQGGGVIVNTASVAGLIGLPNRAAYCASKGAVVTLTKQVAVDYVAQGIRCNCICPGTVDTPWVGRLLREAEDPDALRAELVARQPMGRLGTAEEVAQAALYLASDDAAFVTGTALVIDGGLMAR
jgi:NAD(P)-dependent dehydrogenase (short-subunit alcohol dehydrogenase family)